MRRKAPCKNAPGALAGNTPAKLLARSQPTCMTRFSGLSSSNVAPLSSTVHPSGRGQPLKYTSVLQPTPPEVTILLAIEDEDEGALVRRLVPAAADGQPGARAPLPREWSACRPQYHSVHLGNGLDWRGPSHPAIDMEWQAVADGCTLRRFESCQAPAEDQVTTDARWLTKSKKVNGEGGPLCGQQACAGVMLALMLQELQTHLDTGLQRLHQELLTKCNAVVVQILD